MQVCLFAVLCSELGHFVAGVAHGDIGGATVYVPTVVDVDVEP